MKTINADQAAELLLELFKAKPWLNKPGTMESDDFHKETEAILFLQRFTAKQVDSYSGINESAQRVVTSLLHDFMYKLMHPEHPLSKKTWAIDDSQSMPDQALQVIAAEIAQSHPRKQDDH